jgi:16S rRNA (adenine1518-N6/adenine1519-N6)-dimethyltransferase
MRATARQRELGQNFLVDRNILDVIMRLAAVQETDVVLEVGGGEGILSERLAQAVRWLHLIEKDQQLDDRLRAALGRFPNVDLLYADATRVDLAALTPPPTKMVANLPYGVAATVILRTIAELPTIGSWVVMVQREVGERFAAQVGASNYGIPSVLAQLSCEVRVLRPVSRNVFRPIPNVDSVLLGLTRRTVGEGSSAVPVAVAPDVSTIIHGAFSHRRKALAGSLALSLTRPSSGPGIRERVHEVLVAMGHPADARAQTLAPDEFVTLTEALR